MAAYEVTLRVVKEYISKVVVEAGDVGEAVDLAHKYYDDGEYPQEQHKVIFLENLEVDELI